MPTYNGSPFCQACNFGHFRYKYIYDTKWGTHDFSVRVQPFNFLPGSERSLAFKRIFVHFEVKSNILPDNKTHKTVV